VDESLVQRESFTVFKQFVTELATEVGKGHGLPGVRSSMDDINPERDETAFSRLLKNCHFALYEET
jgi:hypothetical protein